MNLTTLELKGEIVNHFTQWAFHTGDHDRSVRSTYLYQKIMGIKSHYGIAQIQ